MRPALVLLGIALVGCGDESRREPPPVADTTAGTPIADSLLLTLSDSTRVWFVAGRQDTSSTGEVCIERLLELRRDDRRLPVPLLYTMGTPKAINDSTLRAALYRHCEIQAWYLVDTRTGLPKPVRGS
jgi:hypothetical protein